MAMYELYRANDTVYVVAHGGKGAIPVPGGFVAFNTNLSRISAQISYYTQRACHAVGMDSRFAVHLRF